MLGTMSRRGPTYDAARITRLITPSMRQAPPIRVQARGLRIAPMTQRILTRIEGRREDVQGRAERQLGRAWEAFEQQTVQPLGDAPERGPAHAPCTSVPETTRQWEDLQRFRLFTDLETDVLERDSAIFLILRLLRENVEMLREIAVHGNVCVDPRPLRFTVGGVTYERAPLPSVSDVVAAIVTEELARAATGSIRGGSYLSAPTGRTLTFNQAQDLAAVRARARFGLRPVPNGVLLFRPEIGRVLDHLRQESTRP